MTQPTDTAIDPWAEIARLQKELDAAVAYHDECAQMIEDALGTDARKYNEGSTLFQHYASDIRRIRRERSSTNTPPAQPTESTAEIAERLLPCPFCGSTNITFTDSVEEHGGYISWSEVRCDDCDANSGYFKMNEPIENWNRRDGVAAALQAERERGDKLDAELDQYRREGIESAFPNLWARISELQAKLVTERERALEEAASYLEKYYDYWQVAEEVRALAQKGGGE